MCATASSTLGRCSVVQDDDWVAVARSCSVADKRDEFAPFHWLPRRLSQDIATDQTRTVETMIAFAVRIKGARRRPHFAGEATGLPPDPPGGGPERITITRGEGRHIAAAMERV